ncbi:hypothetical protein RHMOL_Rhmol04G0030700 [Rhododendron molle]|uniref:Uncharacterized protein n=1 Tax=Rhododendron molle TaxID=49168 RepID=A0ACC0NYX8_RHOML|nr:hypothetical protein RHMOL_Rhmol04G0030700 [Rhododendron molle]
MSPPPMASNTQSSFEDFLPIMAHKLGGDALIGELCNGFRLLMDGDKGVLTFDSLKKNAAVLGLQELTDGDLRSMLREGDFDGDGALNQMEFCVLMFRLSPELMEQSQFLLEEALDQIFLPCCRVQNVQSIHRHQSESANSPKRWLVGSQQSTGLEANIRGAFYGASISVMVTSLAETSWYVVLKSGIFSID